MTDQEREALVERMLDAFHATKPLSLQSCMRAALAVAETVVREDEREACAMVADTCDLPWNSPSQEQHDDAIMMAERIAIAIRARGAA